MISSPGAVGLTLEVRMFSKEYWSVRLKYLQTHPFMLLVLICFIMGPVFFLVVLPEKFGVNPITDSNFLPYIRGAVIVFVTFMGWQIFWVSVADFKNGKSK
jgi:hypothetical protein